MALGKGSWTGGLLLRRGVGSTPLPPPEDLPDKKPVWCSTNTGAFVASNLACGKARRRKHPRSPDMSGGLRSNTATGQVGRNPLGGHSLRRMLCCSILTYPCGYASAFAPCATARQASLAPRLRHKSLAAIGQLFMRHSTRNSRFHFDPLHGS